MEDSIFTKIIKGEIPCHKIYEDEKTFAFLDIHPVQPGHVLVVPKNQTDHLWDLPDEDYQALTAACKKIANKIMQELKPLRVGEQVVGIDVAHAHVHLYPFNNIEEYRNIPDMNAEPDHEALAQMAEKLRIKGEN